MKEKEKERKRKNRQNRNKKGQKSAKDTKRIKTKEEFNQQIKRNLPQLFNKFIQISFKTKHSFKEINLNLNLHKKRE